MTSERFDTVIVGGGQAGLATAHFLKQQGRNFVVLDAHERVGDAWRKRWDSLRLFTPAKYNGLPGLRFPGSRVSFPTKDEMADYLASYATRFDIPVRSGVRVERLTKDGDGYVITTADGSMEASNVVVATGAHHLPKAPSFAANLDPAIVQLHSSAYRGPSQLRDGDVLVVGLGNSGAEIALELAKTHKVHVSGNPTAQIPFEHGPNAARFALPLVRFAGMHVLTTRTPIGRKARPKFSRSAAPLIRTKLSHLEAAGVAHVGRTTGVSEGRPVLDDGTVLDVANVVWCTGFTPSFGWIDLPVFDDEGLPRHRRGVVESSPGLYFVGLVFQLAAASDVVTGVGRDARYVVRQLGKRRQRFSIATPAISSAGSKPKTRP